jgi:hypothetical protein
MKSPHLKVISRLASLLGQTNDLVACNVYVSAGRKQHAGSLLHILKSSQELCQELRMRQQENGESDISNNRIALVHAYADGPYDRSSFHLAGSAECVALVASHVATTAIDTLHPFFIHQQEENKAGNRSQHPLVGIVDHVSVMPLVQSTAEILQNETDQQTPPPESTSTCSSADGDEFSRNADIYVPPDASGLAALYVAHKLRLLGVHCHPYGTADQNHSPLASVRKQKTSFFKSGALDSNSCKRMDNNFLGECTVGSPPEFVENFNVRLTANVSKKQAMQLTKKVRERDGGIIGVEALTLPYSEGRFEVACNLLQPKIGSSAEIMKAIREWIDELNEENGSTGGTDHDYYIDEAYRVGCTAGQCMAAINKNEERFEGHDLSVIGNMHRYLHNSFQTF